LQASDNVRVRLSEFSGERFDAGADSHDETALVNVVSGYYYSSSGSGPEVLACDGDFGETPDLD
jgi:hypothetical protein